MRHPKKNFLLNPGRLYCFADSVTLCRTLLEAGARVIQLRHKTVDDGSFRRLAAEMLDCVHSFEDAVLIINDRVDIALEIGADGIHVGQEDRDYREVVRLAPESMIVGVSARTPTSPEPPQGPAPPMWVLVPSLQRPPSRRRSSSACPAYRRWSLPWKSRWWPLVALPMRPSGWCWKPVLVTAPLYRASTMPPVLLRHYADF